MLVGVSLSGWFVGYVIAAVAITIVVVCVAIILALARRIGIQAEQITNALDEARINTLPLWDVDKINGGVRSITRSASEARAILGGQ